MLLKSIILREISHGIVANMDCDIGVSEFKLDYIHFCNIEQVLATTPHKTPTIRPLASHHENYTS